MLEPEMNLDTDLGIDSIKRVEILAAVQEQLPELPEIGAEQAGSVQSLADLATLLESTLTRSWADQADQGGSSFPKSSAAPRDDRAFDHLVAASSLKSWTIAAVPTNPVSRQIGEQRIGQFFNGLEAPILLIGGDDPWERAICHSLTQFADHLDLRRLDREEALRCDLPESLGGLLLMGSGFEPVTMAHDGFRLIQRFAKALRKTGSNSEALLGLITHLDGAFGLNEGSQFDPRHLAWAGLVKTSAREWPEVRAVILDLDPQCTTHQEQAHAWVEALATAPTGSEIGFSASGRRCEIQLQSQPSAEMALDSDPLWDPGEVILISGGARGVTSEVAYQLARTYQPTLILLGRSPEPTEEPPSLAELEDEASLKRALIRVATNSPSAKTSPRQIQDQLRQILAGREIRSTLQRLRDAGAKATYLSVDVRNRAEVRATLDRIGDRFGPVRGLIHAAGVLADSWIETKTPDQFDRVYATKVLGLNNLLSGLDPNSLKALVTFSSTTARFGRVGQSDYAAANEVLNATARQFAAEHPNCRTLSLNWGPWDGGMVQDALKDLFAQEGIGLIPQPEGARFLIQHQQRTGDSSAPSSVDRVVLGSDLPESLLRPQSSTVGAESSFVPPQFHQQSDQQRSDPDLPPIPVDDPDRMREAFRIDLGLDDFPILNSHVLDGRPVVPLALIIEWLGHAAQHLNPMLRFQGFAEFTLHKGIILEPNQPVLKLVVSCEQARSTSDGSGCYTCLSQLASLERDGQLRPRAQATMRLVERLADAPDSVTLPALTRAEPLLSPADLYPQLLFHGPELHAIQQVDLCQEDRIQARLRSRSRPTQWSRNPLRGSWLADPMAIDGALQAVIVWSQHQHGLPCLPTGMTGYHQYRRRWPNDGVVAVARLQRQGSRGIEATIDLHDQTGGLIARLEGVRSIADPSLIRAFAKNDLNISTQTHAEPELSRREPVRS